MEHGQNLLFFQILYQSRSLLQIFRLNVKHMSIMCALFRDIGKIYLFLLFQLFQFPIILVPGIQPGFVDFIRMLKLRPQISCVQLAWQIGRTRFHPCVLINLAPEKLTAVCPLFPDDLRQLVIFLSPDEQGSALAHTVVFCLMEAVASKISDTPQHSSLICGHNSLGGVLDNFQMILPGNLADLIHLTAHARIMNRDDRLCLFCNGILYQIFINVHRIRADIDKHRFCPAQYKSIRRGHKRIRRHDHLVSRLYPRQNGRHLRSMSAGSRQKRFLHTRFLFNPLAA